MKSALIKSVFVSNCPYCSNEHRHRDNIASWIKCSSCDCTYSTSRDNKLVEAVNAQPENDCKDGNTVQPTEGDQKAEAAVASIKTTPKAKGRRKNA